MNNFKNNLLPDDADILPPSSQNVTINLFTTEDTEFHGVKDYGI